MANSNILEKGIGVGNTSILDTAMIKLAEFGTDELSSKVGFNGTWVSGGAKMVSAIGLSYLLPKGFAQNINSGLMADGMTDVYVWGKKALFGSKSSNGMSGGTPQIRVI